MNTTRYVCLLVAVLVIARAQQPENPALASFDQVWNTVRARHWDPEKTGAAWDRARAELRPEAARVHSAAEVRPFIQRLLDTLHQSHFGVIPAEAYDKINDGSADGLAQPAFDFRILDGEAVITRGSAAIRRGWTILRIGSQDVPALIEKARGVANGQREMQLISYTVLLHRMSGNAGDIKTITFGVDKSATMTCDVELVSPEHVARLGNLPPIPMQIESRKLDDSTGYFRFNAFFEPEWLQAELGAAVRACSSCSGFVIDLRGNFGGLVGLVPAVAAWFVPERRPMGTLISTTGTLKLNINPRAETFHGRLALLIDSLSVSSAEFLAAGLKDLGRARLFGETTQGAALPSSVEKLPDGDQFQFVTANYVSAAGKAVEGAGVMPHETVRLNRNALLIGHDPALEAARLWLSTKE